MRNGGAGLRVIVLHGAHGGPDTNWFSWLHAALNAEGIEVLRPRFPTPQGQSLEAWLNTYDLAVASLPLVPTILVGHSLGAALALRLVERAVEPFDGLFLAVAFIVAGDLQEHAAVRILTDYGIS
jgi:predicted alpha/beta hydrolase family esterase